MTPRDEPAGASDEHSRRFYGADGLKVKSVSAIFLLHSFSENGAGLNIIMMQSAIAGESKLDISLLLIRDYHRPLLMWPDFITSSASRKSVALRRRVKYFRFDVAVSHSLDAPVIK